MGLWWLLWGLAKENFYLIFPDYEIQAKCPSLRCTLFTYFSDCWLEISFLGLE
jgi:hypothetical protein